MCADTIPNTVMATLQSSVQARDCGELMSKETAGQNTGHRGTASSGGGMGKAAKY